MSFILGPALCTRSSKDLRRNETPKKLQTRTDGK